MYDIYRNIIVFISKFRGEVALLNL